MNLAAPASRATIPSTLFTLGVAPLLVLLAACSDEAVTPAAGGGSSGQGGGVAMGGSAGMAGAPVSTGGMSGAAGRGGSTFGGGGSSAGAATAGGGTGGATGGGGAGGVAGTGGAGGAADPGVNHVPADYMGKPFKPLTIPEIPGTISFADYDRGGAGVAWCMGKGGCAAGINTGDWAPADTPPYREPQPAGGKICGGAACDDNVGLCRMNPAKPDNTIEGVPVTPADTYIGYIVTGEWWKYTVHVAAAGTYSISGFVAAPGGVSLSIDFGGGVTTGKFPVPASPLANCKCGEAYHAWQTVTDVAMVTFAEPGTYLMTVTVEAANLNADKLVFTKM